jgi:chloride channel 3/4/5
VETWEYHDFPVVQNGTLLGYVVREKLRSFIGLCPAFSYCVVVFDLANPLAEPFLSESGGATRTGKFHQLQDGDSADLSPLLEDTMQLRKEVPLELVVNTFRKLVSSLYFDY